MFVCLPYHQQSVHLALPSAKLRQRGSIPQCTIVQTFQYIPASIHKTVYSSIIHIICSKSMKGIQYTVPETLNKLNLRNFSTLDLTSTKFVVACVKTKANIHSSRKQAGAYGAE